ncbi:hypothetical protein J6590_026586 [Homalodisca vitripennis]|nr:hypothetical protein J6590_026586 [Homalodisca vitripennis]
MAKTNASSNAVTTPPPAVLEGDEVTTQVLNGTGAVHQVVKMYIAAVMSQVVAKVAKPSLAHVTQPCLSKSDATATRFRQLCDCYYTIDHDIKQSLSTCYTVTPL